MNERTPTDRSGIHLAWRRQSARDAADPSYPGVYSTISAAGAAAVADFVLRETGLVQVGLDGGSRP